MKNKLKNEKLIQQWLDACAKLLHEEIKNNPPPDDVNEESKEAWRLMQASDTVPFVFVLKGK